MFGRESGWKCSSHVKLISWLNGWLDTADYRLGAAMKSCKGPLSGFLCSVNLFILWERVEHQPGPKTKICFLADSKLHFDDIKNYNCCRLTSDNTWLRGFCANDFHRYRVYRVTLFETEGAICSVTPTFHQTLWLSRASETTASSVQK